MRAAASDELIAATDIADLLVRAAACRSARRTASSPGSCAPRSTAGSTLSELTDEELAALSAELAAHSELYCEVLRAELVARVEGLRGRHRARAGRASSSSWRATALDADASADFYARPVLEVARELIGCVVEHRPRRGEPLTSGVIVETEAYHDSEPACHAFVGLTPRTRILFGPPGRAYVYRSYGIHAMLNAVCEPEGVGAAVLIRALEPLEGIEPMRARRRRVGGQDRERDEELCSGPGKLTQALGIELSDNGVDLARGPVRIRPREAALARAQIVAGTRIGITKAVELPWRFCVATTVTSPAPARARNRLLFRQKCDEIVPSLNQICACP